MSEDGWTCYRRNYFQVSCSFSIFTADGTFSKNELPCSLYDQLSHNIYNFTNFSVGVFGRDLNSNKQVELIQHTAKREKGSQHSPIIMPINIDQDPGLGGNINNHATITFKRIQFKNSTINSNKRNTTQQYYVLEIRLFANCPNGVQIPIAINTSKPIVVRGRSPGYYPENHKLSVSPYGIPSRSISERPDSSISHQNIIQVPSFNDFDRTMSSYTTPMRESSTFYSNADASHTYHQQTPAQKTTKPIPDIGKNPVFLHSKQNFNSEYEIRPVHDYPFSPSRQNNFRFQNNPPSYAPGPPIAEPIQNHNMENHTRPSTSKKSLNDTHYNPNIQFYNDPSIPHSQSNPNQFL
ncbi:Protein pacG [Smittium mucronatum]|uniref:Protein pacG n=1 Tax=Smittium mucronatum TaxID=133383 RepID=A0A1R0H1M4_9FUNG|nr:Protein pacG [Smittium mucronatum]